MFSLVKKNSELTNLPEAHPIITESIIESLVPVGYLGQKYFNYRISPMLLSSADKYLIAKNNFINNKSFSQRQLVRYIMWKIYPLALSYGKSKKILDRDFINVAINVLSNLVLMKKNNAG